jgi:hypothetical protein
LQPCRRHHGQAVQCGSEGLSHPLPSVEDADGGSDMRRIRPLAAPRLD